MWRRLAANTSRYDFKATHALQQESLLSNATQHEKADAEQQHINTQHQHTMTDTSIKFMTHVLVPLDSGPQLPTEPAPPHQQPA